MTKEELEKEAEEYRKEKLIERKDKFVFELPEVYIADIKQAYLAGAESREKQIQIDAEQIRALQKQNGELTDELKALQESVKDYGAGCYENGLRNGRRSNKLTEAKEIIRELLNIIDYLNEDEYGKEDFPVVHKAEAFLKE